MFSFEALLSTALSRGYSQGLIHRKALREQNPDTKKRQADRIAMALECSFQKKGSRQARTACL